MPKLILHAPRIHSGGGLVLLAAALEALEPGSVAVLDTRLPESMKLPAGVEIHRIKTGLGSYFSGDRLLCRISEQNPSLPVLCFSNLPPRFRLKATTSVFVQNRYVLETGNAQAFEPKTRARLAFERVWFRLNRKNADLYLVQSDSMARRLMEAYPELTVRVAPFIEIAKFDLVDENSREADFLYIASADPHKNHAQLLEAWKLLASEGHRPRLALVFPRDLGGEVEIEAKRVAELTGAQISIWPSVSHADRMQLFSRAKALIFPSLFESYGLPLVEAARAGLPILASELDFVRDSVVPQETFDPRSALSIARAVKRHLNLGGEPTRPLTSADFLNVASAGIP